MYYLAKFCRLCIKTDVELIDVESKDIDSIKFSQKLEECTKMIITKESLSTNICIQCIKNLRISYDFHKMCKKSNNLLQGIISELVNEPEITVDNFKNSEIRVTLSPLKLIQHPKKRITKTERCSILRSLLSYKNEKKNNINLDTKGGLKDIIEFTTNFNFGYNDISSTPLNKLVQFSEEYFKRDFTQFRETVLYIIDNNFDNNVDEEEEMFNTSPIEIKKEIPFEEVIIEPDITVKTEIEDQEFDENFNCDNFKKKEIFSSFSNLNKLKETCQKSFPCSSARCRTRGSPYISPQLKKQFMLRSFQCKTCPRYFKTPGYLKAHCAKVHNQN